MRELVFRSVALCGVLIVNGSAPALAEDDGVKLSKEELEQLIPGTKAAYVIKQGSTHRWINEPDGKFVASTDAKAINATGATGSSARGTWHISDEGKYCISIDWKREAENWCRFVYRTADNAYYMTNTDTPNAERRKLELAK